MIIDFLDGISFEEVDLRNKIIFVQNRVAYLRNNSDFEEYYSEYDDRFSSKLVVKRQNIWYDTFSFLSGMPLSIIISKKLEISFENETGQDSEGTSREFYTLVFKDLLDPAKGFFEQSPNGITLQPSPLSSIIPNDLLHFKYAGRLVGKAILDGYDCEIDLKKFFLKQILGLDLCISDLEDIDPALCKNLLWMLNNDISQEDLNLDFSYTYHELDQ